MACSHPSSHVSHPSPAAALLSAGGGLWRMAWPGRGSLDQRPVLAGVADRALSLDGLRTVLGPLVLAQQVHGVSLAAIGDASCVLPVAGCDGLTTALPDVTLVIRTADCLPILAWDPIQHVAGILHAGWRGLAGGLPRRLIVWLREVYGSRPSNLWLAIGPAIRACCYDVGAEFEARFGSFVRMDRGRRTCDLIGAATQQLVESGVAAERVLDSGCCTACDAARWHSVRRDGQHAGRLLSFIRLGAMGR